jgi:hypothetical protein
MGILAEDRPPEHHQTAIILRVCREVPRPSAVLLEVPEDKRPLQTEQTDQLRVLEVAVAGRGAILAPVQMEKSSLPIRRINILFQAEHSHRA